MRAFVAIELSDEIKGCLSQAQSHLKYSGADVKWVEKENIHLTLKFLGDITEDKAKKVGTMLEGIASSAKPFELTLKDIGAFPKTDSPRVIWAGLDKGAKESTDIAKRTDEELLKIGFEPEARPFAAHITIGRVRSPKNKEALKEKILSVPKSWLSDSSSQRISSIALFQSTLTPDGPVYTKIYEAILGGA